MLVNIHRIESANVGDLMSSPLRYFNFPTNTQVIDIMNVNDTVIFKNDILIGGGGLIARDFFAEKMNYIAANKKGKLISWGIGHNSYEGLGKHLSYPDYLNVFDLHGIRDYDRGFNYVPCVSCMSSLFDRKYEVKHEIAIYSHGYSQWKIENTSFPIMTNEILQQSQSRWQKKINNMLEKYQGTQRWLDQHKLLSNARKIIKFLGEADTIVTSSYHGMYWGILLNKKVLAIPFSTKFYTLKYPVTICNTDNWQEKIKEARRYSEALEECREINRQFYEKVVNVIMEKR
jgi:hypothetical protein